MTLNNRNSSVNPNIMVRMWITLFSIVVLTLNFGCCPGESTRSIPAAGQINRDSLRSSEGQATTFQRNASSVTAVIDSVRAAGENAYVLYCTLSAVEPVQSMPVFVQAGQSVALEPDFDLLTSGLPDPASVRNKRLLSVRSALPGKTIKGTITLRENGKWILLDITEIK